MMYVTVVRVIFELFDLLYVRHCSYSVCVLTFELFNHLVVAVEGSLENGLWVVHLPPPFRPHWISVVPV